MSVSEVSNFIFFFIYNTTTKKRVVARRFFYYYCSPGLLALQATILTLSAETVS